MIARVVFALALIAICAQYGAAETVDTPICKQDLAATWQKMQEMVGRLKGVARAAQDEKCATYRRHADVVVRARTARGPGRARPRLGVWPFLCSRF